MMPEQLLTTALYICNHMSMLLYKSNKANTKLASLPQPQGLALQGHKHGCDGAESTLNCAYTVTYPGSLNLVD